MFNNIICNVLLLILDTHTWQIWMITNYMCICSVARDNPLYVDPEAVVGDGAEAA